MTETTTAQARGVPAALWLRAKAAAAIRRMTMGQVVAEALRMWLDRKGEGDERD